MARKSSVVQLKCDICRNNRITNPYLVRGRDFLGWKATKARCGFKAIRVVYDMNAQRLTRFSGRFGGGLSLTIWIAQFLLTLNERKQWQEHWRAVERPPRRLRSATGKGSTPISGVREDLNHTRRRVHLLKTQSWQGRLGRLGERLADVAQPRTLVHRLSRVH